MKARTTSAKPRTASKASTRPGARKRSSSRPGSSRPSATRRSQLVAAPRASREDEYGGLLGGLIR
ncbi:MAG TPA: hypothetical protein VGG35_11480 [Streptosporangiaceae bacterium]